MIKVRVPCSTSNLGPGFDSLGLALGLYLEVKVEAAARDVLVREGDALFRAVKDEHDFFLQAMRARWRVRGTPRRGVRAVLRSELPTARGLGSSSVAVVAGVMVADALDGVAHDARDVVAAAARIEGHPDNVAPATLGGLCCAYQDEAAVHALRLGDLPGVRAVVVSPDTPLETAKARAALPASIPHREATRNLGRAVYLSHALARGERGDLAWAFLDALHQPYRATLLPGLEEALAGALRAGALGAFLSGAGSSAIALVREGGDAEAVSEAMRTAYHARGIAAQARTLDVDRAGATVER